MLIGGHVSTRGGIDRAVDQAELIGAEVIQTHPSPPQQWQPLRIEQGMVDSYSARAEAAGLRGHWFHAVYLVNLATQDATLLRRSIGSLVHYMDLAQRLGVDGVVFHPGSHKGAGFEAMLPQIGAAIREVLGRSASPARLVVENSAGAGDCVGRTFDEVGAICDVAGDDERIGVCLDTCHSFASGYDLRSAEGVEAAIGAFAEQVGVDRLCCVHANDSRTGLGSNRDRHANIGEGEMGAESFRRLTADPRLRAVPWILEVPGSGQGPDLAQVNRLRELAGLAPAAAAAPAAGGTTG